MVINKGSTADTIEAICRVIDSYWADVKTGNGASTDELTKLLDRLINEFGVTSNEFAQVLGYDKHTVMRWLEGTNVPRANVKPRLRQLPELVRQFRGTERAAVPYDLLPEYLTGTELAQRQRLCSDVWIMKWNRRYLTLEDPNILATLEWAVKQGVDIPDKTTLHYVLPAPSLIRKFKCIKQSNDGGPRPPSLLFESDWTAFRSYRKVEEQILKFGIARDRKELRQHLKLHLLETVEDLLLIGLPRLDMGYALLEYHRNGQEELKKPWDVLVEFDAQMVPPAAATIGEPRTSGAQETKESLWFEMARSSASAILLQWDYVLPTLRRQPQDGYKNEDDPPVGDLPVDFFA